MNQSIYWTCVLHQHILYTLRLAVVNTCPCFCASMRTYMWRTWPLFKWCWAWTISVSLYASNASNWAVLVALECTLSAGGLLIVAVLPCECMKIEALHLRLCFCFLIQMQSLCAQSYQLGEMKTGWLVIDSIQLSLSYC